MRPMHAEAHAFWLRAPGVGEIRPVDAARARARTTCWCAPCAPGVSRGTETLVFRGGVPPAQYADDAGAVSGGGLPGPGQVRLPQRRRRGAGTAGAARPHGLLPVPAPDRLRGAGRRGDRRARGRAARSRRARRHGRDRGQRPVGRRATARRPGHRRRRRHGRLLRRAPAEPVPGGAGHARRRRPRPGRRRRRARRRLRAARRRRRTAATWSCTPARRPPGSSGRSTCSRPRAPSSTSAGTATARSGCRWAARSTRVASASAPARSARSPRPARGRRTTADRLALALELLRDPAFDALVTGQSRFGELPDVMARLAAGSLPALCHTITYDGESDRVQRDRPRSHDDRPQLPRRGVRARAAPARRDVRRRRHVPARRPRRRQHRGRHRRGRPRSCTPCWPSSPTATSTTSPPSRA